jgi:sulfatase modifying factor 1
MVRIDNFCIDSTEVTVDHYTQFLAAKGGDVSGQPPACSAWNQSFVPGGWPTGAGAQAVSGVNWCMAFMYCAWAGKRLCGSPSGGPADSLGYRDPAKSEWFNACSRNQDGLHAYPYGNVYDPRACNGTDYLGAGQGRPLPSLSTCQGGYPGLFDMSGNVNEWEDSCSPSAPDSGAPSGQNDGCLVRGGGFGYKPAELRCDFAVLGPRNFLGGDVGIRCCSK